MHRIDTPTAQTDKFGAGKNGFTRGNPQTGVPATALDDDYFDAIQEELAGIVEAAGIVLDKNNRAQVLAAIQHLITAGIPDIKDASLTQKGIVQLSNATNSNSQILAATPKAVSDLGGLLLKIGNNLSEIKDAGPAAVSQTLANLGLGDAAKQGVATNAQMAVGAATNLLPTVAAVMSIFSKRSFASSDYIRIPDVTNGIIIQSGITPVPTATGGVNVTGTYPLPFPNACRVVVGSVIGSADFFTLTGLPNTINFNGDVWDRTTTAVVGGSLLWIAIGY